MDGASHVLELQGELDLASVGALYTAVDSLAPEAHEIVLDMGGLTFMDSTGLYVLLRLRGVCRDHHSRLVLCSVSPRIRRLLEITGLLAPMREQGFVRE